MPLTLFFALLCLAFGISSPAWAAGFTLSDLKFGSGVIAFTEVRGPHAYTADGGLQFSLDWDAVGDTPVRLDFKMSWVPHVLPGNDGYGGEDGLSGYMYGGFGWDGKDWQDWAAVEPTYQNWTSDSVAFGYANLTPRFSHYQIVWDMFGWGDTVDWRLEYALAPVPLPAAGLLLASALGLGCLSRRRGKSKNKRSGGRENPSCPRNRSLVTSFRQGM
jgi:hypothetical protein